MQPINERGGYRINWGPPEAQSLTSREREILRLVAEGRGNREIGDRLGISSRTVKVHLANIFEKLGVNRRMEAVAVLSSKPQFMEARAS